MYIQGKGAGGAHLHGRRTGLFQGEHIRTDDSHIGSSVRPPGSTGRRIVVTLIVGIVGGVVEHKAADIRHCIAKYDRYIDDDLLTGRDVDANGRVLDHEVDSAAGIDRNPRLRSGDLSDADNVQVRGRSSQIVNDAHIV